MKNIAAKHRKRRKALERQRQMQKEAMQSVTPGVIRPLGVTQSREDVVLEGPALDIPSNKTLFAEDVHADNTLPITSLGTGLKLTSRTTVNFTTDLARDLLDPTKFTPFEPDRPFSKDWSNTLLKAMRQGTFRWEQVQLIICALSGKHYRMNGQHTAWSRLYFENAPANLPVQMLRYTAATENDMRILYSSIDRGKARTRANVIQSYLFGSEQFRGFTKDTIRRLAEGVAYWLWGIERDAHRTGDEVAYVMETDQYGLSMKVGNFYDKNCKGAGSMHLRRSPVMAAMYATFEVAETASVEFWDKVRTGAELSATDARLKLRNRLLSHAVNAGRGGGSYKHMVSADDMYVWCIQAWNAWRKGQTVGQFKGMSVYKSRPRPE